MKYEFEPIEALWRFHLIYMILMFVLGLSFFPEKIYPSFLVVSGVAFVGILADKRHYFLTSHVLAVAIGLLSPVIFFFSLLWWQTAVILIFITVAGFILREYLF